MLRVNLIIAFLASMGATNAVGSDTLRQVTADVCVYTATPAGILAAIAVKREGKSVVIIEPGRWVGGMLGAGLKPIQDCPNYIATGGLTHELLPKLGTSLPPLVETDARSLNPTAVRNEFESLLAQHGVAVYYEHRLGRVDKNGPAIRSAFFDRAPFDETGCPIETPEKRDAIQVIADMYIDASYEGDFLPAAGVSYRVGRESEQEFGEEHAGVQQPLETVPISPFVTAENPDSGLLKLVESDHGKPIGSADDYTQAYNYRYYTTDNPEYRLPIEAPANYQPQDFELVGRYVEYLFKTTPDENSLRKKLIGIYPGWLNSGEWNYQRSSLFSMSPLGISQIYASGDEKAKARVWKQHQDYLKGLAEFMRTDSRVPSWYREYAASLGLDRRAHPETQGWPHQLYIRVARRLKGQYTITAHDVYNKTTINDSIGLAQYGIDTYPARRIWFEKDDEVLVGIEGKMFLGGNRGPTDTPYPIPYRAITPAEAECTNLLVPVCFSATHLGYASARMEPVFMICGESSGIAACQAITEKSSIQSINMTTYRETLLKAGQKLAWDETVDRPKLGASHKKPTFTMAALLEECDANHDGKVTNHEWSTSKPGWEWLLQHIDKNSDSQIDEREYGNFQDFKTQNADWQQKLKATQP